MNPRLIPPATVARSAMRSQSDARLADLVRAGSEPAFEAIVVRHRRPLVRHCARVVGDADAEEVAQDTLLKAHSALLDGAPVHSLAPWLHVIAHNTALSYLRARRARPQVADIDFDRARGLHAHVPPADRSTEFREELHDVLDAVSSLPDRQRDAIVMRELEGRSYEEIAVRLGSSHGAVRQLLRRARSSVRERLGALVPIEPLLRWALAGAGGAEAAGGASVSGVCVLGVKACIAAMLPATVALVVSAPATTHAARPAGAQSARALSTARGTGELTPSRQVALRASETGSRSLPPPPARHGNGTALAMRFAASLSSVPRATDRGSRTAGRHGAQTQTAGRMDSHAPGRQSAGPHSSQPGDVSAGGRSAQPSAAATASTASASTMSVGASAPAAPDPSTGASSGMAASAGADGSGRTAGM